MTNDDVNRRCTELYNVLYTQMKRPKLMQPDFIFYGSRPHSLSLPQYPCLNVVPEVKNESTEHSLIINTLFIIMSKTKPSQSSKLLIIRIWLFSRPKFFLNYENSETNVIFKLVHVFTIINSVGCFSINFQSYKALF